MDGNENMPEIPQRELPEVEQPELPEFEQSAPHPEGDNPKA
ncbi:hypothetical protein [Paenibacillus caui]|nr:hypothetical protein [Paenibacillus caui]